MENATVQPAPTAAPETAPATAAAPAPAAGTSQVLAAYEGRSFNEIPLDGMRKTIAARLTEAKQTIPHFYLRRSVELDALMAFRAQLNGQLAEQDIKLSVNDFIIKACARALQLVPDANAIWAGDRIVKMDRSDVAVAALPSFSVSHSSFIHTLPVLLTVILLHSLSPSFSSFRPFFPL